MYFYIVYLIYNILLIKISKRSDGVEECVQPLWGIVAFHVISYY